MAATPLAGFTIGVTADRRAEEQIQLLSGRGADCLHGRVIRTHPVGCAESLRTATEALLADPPDLVVLTTGVGVRSWLETVDALQLGEPLRAVLGSAEVWARGPKAKGAAITIGLDVSWTAPNARYDDVVTFLSASGVAGRRIAVQLDGAGARGLCGRLVELGADIVEVPVYRWSLPEDTAGAERLVRAVADGRVDGVTFTARPAVENFLSIAEDLGRSEDVAEAFAGRVTPFCIGPVCAEAFVEAGLARPPVPERHRLGALVQLVTQHLARRARVVRLAGRTVRMQGRRADVEPATGDLPRTVLLSDRERALLEVLLAQPGAVHPKAALLESVWGPEESDTHVVEVTIARLRQRLGPAGAGIETVFRRGYRAGPG